MSDAFEKIDTPEEYYSLYGDSAVKRRHALASLTPPRQSSPNRCSVSPLRAKNLKVVPAMYSARYRYKADRVD